MVQEKLWTKEFIVVNLIQLSVIMGYFVLYSTIGIYTRGITSAELWVGLVTGIFTFASLLTRSFSGKLLDRFYPKKVLLFGLMLSLLASIGYLFAGTMPWLIAMRVVNGFGYGLSSAAVATMISSMLPSDRLLEGLGYSMMFFTLCGAIGPSLGLNLSHSDYRLFDRVFIVTLLFAVLSVVLACFFKTKEINFSSETVPKNLVQDKMNSSITLATLIFLLLTFLLAFSQSTVVACLNLYALDRGLGNMSLFFVLFATANFLARLFMNQILQLFSERFIFIGIIVLQIFVYLGIFAADRASWTYVLAIPYGVSMGFCYPLLTTKTIKTISQFRQGTSNSLYLASEDMAFFLGAVFWSGISDLVGGYQQVYLIAALLVVVMLWIVLLYPSLLKKYHVKEEVW